MSHVIAAPRKIVNIGDESAHAVMMSALRQFGTGQG
jgi:hypothetical protein